jgi:hypothetical protein
MTHPSKFMTKRKKRKARVSGQVFLCDGCKACLAIRSFGFGFGGMDADWFMVKDAVWRQSQRQSKCRFLCVECLEERIGRELSAADFRRSAKVNFTGRKSDRLRKRMRGLIPAKRLIETRFTP